MVSVKELKAELKAKFIRGFSGLKKAELIILLRDGVPKPPKERKRSTPGVPKVKKEPGAKKPKKPKHMVLKKYKLDQYDEEEQKNLVEQQTHEFALKSKNNMSLQKHQTDFIKQFVYSNLHGAIVYHGVGTGKTLTAVVSSYWYLKLYPNSTVVVISPSALLYNFIESMILYGLDIQDNRYVFTTYDKYVRLKDKVITGLLIVDEAHNLRTEMKIYDITNPETQEKISRGSEKNKRGFNVLEYGAMNSHKILLLTGTAFVNGIYDIENLLAMIDKRPPLRKKTFEEILSSPSNITDYFSYRISYFINPQDNDLFPERREKLIYLQMTEKEMKDYESEKDNENPFYIDEKRAANTVSKEDDINPKIKWCINEVLKKPKQKFIIYTGLYAAGVKLLEREMYINDIPYTKITGKENAKKKAENKTNYNDWEGGDDDKHPRVLIITRAGAEGVDTKNTQNIILIDHQWNDATSEQIIARAIRYKSHMSLPPSERYVNVYRLLLCFPSNRPLFDLIVAGNIDYSALNNEISSSVKKQQDIISDSATDETKIPTVAELKKLKIPETNTPYIANYSVMRTRNKKRVYAEEGWDYYDTLNDEQKIEWRIKKYSEWFSAYSPDRKERVNISYDISIDLRLYILCKSKQANIIGFIKYFGKEVKLFESYESKLLKLVYVEERKLKRALTDEEQSDIYNRLLVNEKAEVKTLLFENRTRTKQEKLQQYFTNDTLAQELIDLSGIKDSTTHTRVLEPTAGDGALIIPILKLINVDFDIDLIEIDKDNRAKLESITKNKNTVRVLKHRNFLTYISGAVYDYVFMNPPFHLRRTENPYMIKDTYDVDFVKRAYAMVKEGGKLCAIMGGSFKGAKEGSPLYWINENKKNKKNMKITIKALDKKKYSGKMIANTFIVIIEKLKIIQAEDDKILDIKYYKFKNLTGSDVESGNINIQDIPIPATEVVIPIDDSSSSSTIRKPRKKKSDSSSSSGSNSSVKLNGIKPVDTTKKKRKYERTKNIKI